jgi:hypothetical protein
MLYKNARRRLPAALAIALALTLAACTSAPAVPSGPTADALIDQQSYAAFQTAVAAVPDRRFEVYWLGREFTAAGIEFHGPYFVPLAGVNTETQLSAEYTARGPNGGNMGLSVIVYATAARSNAPTQAAGNPRALLVAGHRAMLWVEESPPQRPVNSLRVEVDFGSTSAVIKTNSVGSAAEGGPDANPLIDEQTFLNVLQNLRPYPQ